MNNYQMGRVVALGLSFLSGMFAQVGIAQQSHSDSSQLEEIVVTAEKRESTVQKTPISLTAISGHDIQDRGLTNLGDLVQSVPGVSIRTTFAIGFPALAITKGSPAAASSMSRERWVFAS